MVRQNKEGQSVPVVLNVAKGALLDESALESARVQNDPITGSSQIGITFTEKGRKAFAEITRTNLNRQIAILIDGKVVSAPVIRTEILGGKALLDGNFSDTKANDLANRINRVVQETQKGQVKPWTHGPYDAR